MITCYAINKHGARCGNAPVRNGLCIYHQPDERTRGLLAKLERNKKQRDRIATELKIASDGRYGW